MLSVGLRSFPSMYASSLILEKVTVSPSSPKVAGLTQRYVVLIAAQIPTEDDTTVTTSELLASGKIDVSLRLYCRVRLATLYRLPLVEKLSPRAWPGPNTATSHGELLPVPHELLPASTAAESGRGTRTVLVLLEALYVIENDAESSVLMQVEFPSFTSRLTA